MELNEQLEKSSRDSEGLGLGLKPGDPHYRAYVGPPQDYDLIAAMTFNLLTTIGLRQHHRLLDIGCGSLRVGRLLIPYLNPGNYVGLEPNKWLVEEGIEREIGQSLLQIKHPRFLFSDSPAILESGMSIDYAVAQSIFSHCGRDLVEPWLYAIGKALAPSGAFVATFLPGKEDTTEAGWIYPGCVRFREETLRELAERANLRFQILDWKHPRQTWALFADNNFDTSWFETNSLTWNAWLETVTRRQKAQ